MDSVIDDTVMDLPKLLAMTPEERMSWYHSLGTLERKQLGQIAGILFGLSIAVPLMEIVAKKAVDYQRGNDGH